MNNPHAHWYEVEYRPASHANPDWATYRSTGGNQWNEPDTTHFPTTRAAWAAIERLMPRDGSGDVDEARIVEYTTTRKVLDNRQQPMTR